MSTSRKCQVCQYEFEGRADAVYCSDSCRQQACRARREAKRYTVAYHLTADADVHVWLRKKGGSRYLLDLAKAAMASDK